MSPPISPIAIALNRFSLGARSDETPPTDPRRWLLGQFDRFVPQPASFGTLPDAGSILQRYDLHRTADRAALDAGRAGDPAAAQKAARQQFTHDAHALYHDAVQARMQNVLVNRAPFIERMVAFWSNHFCVSADNPSVAAFAGAFERDAIRPHVLGRFSDMLLAVEQHPAMLIYLNQRGSIGPDSKAALRAEQRDRNRRPGLNENLGREIMELHTMGVRSGYTQADVTEFARALTGWTIDPGGDDPDAFVFRTARHEPGVRTIMGIEYDEPGAGQAEAALRDFARHPATASHISTALARHFAGDVPPPALVGRLAATFNATRGDLPSLYRTLIDSPEPWAPVALRFKTPWDWTVSVLRGLGADDANAFQIAPLLAKLGQPVWRPGSPAGWDDTDATWAAPASLLQRVELAGRFAAPFGQRLDARTLAPRLLPGALSPETATEIARAESPTASLALLLVSPDFLRR